MIPLNDNFEIENDDSMTFFEYFSRFRDFIKDCIRYFSYLYKIYEYFKKVLYYIYCVISLLFFAIACYLTILLLGFMYRGAKQLFFFLVSYIKYKTPDQTLPVAYQPIMAENKTQGKRKKN